MLYQWGDVDTKYISHSTRKSFMSALYCKYVNDGSIDINATMADLGIDDIPALTDQEKTATIGHCLQSVSGVYHTAEAESDFMHNLKPDQDTYLPGTFWIYNNWDFNVLKTIFEQETEKNFYEALKNDIMDPIGANFQLSDSISWTPTRSIHPAYMFRISATDMSKFGQLMLDKGNWQGNQLIPQVGWRKAQSMVGMQKFMMGTDTDICGGWLPMKMPVPICQTVTCPLDPIRRGEQEDSGWRLSLKGIWYLYTLLTLT
ncbi:serine hydrolase domain-containing protein [Flagellimonas ochracea]|uniref:serine hydrolase domain-containing protein n=1 Tax=Flagellimonas ochracea TaxID=2696472 RepID=UPI0028BD73B4|nr:serine hydrolase [Allomuricauda ochracea]